MITLCSGFRHCPPPLNNAIGPKNFGRNAPISLSKAPAIPETTTQRNWKRFHKQIDVPALAARARTMLKFL